jgi:hypothetical protein
MMRALIGGVADPRVLAELAWAAARRFLTEPFDGYVSIIADYLQGGVLGDEGTGRGVTGRLDAGAARA